LITLYALKGNLVVGEQFGDSLPIAAISIARLPGPWLSAQVPGGQSVRRTQPGQMGPKSRKSTTDWIAFIAL